MIPKTNQWNIDEMQEQAKQPEETTDPSLQALQQCQIMLPLGWLLQLVPRFAESLKLALSPPKPATTPIFLTNPSEGPTVVDTNSPALTVIIKGNEVTSTMIKWGSNINVISQKTCDTSGIWELKSCPFWLRMANTSSVRPTGLIRNLKITIGGHAFFISTVVLHKCVRSVSSTIGQTLAEDGAYQGRKTGSSKTLLNEPQICPKGQGGDW